MEYRKETLEMAMRSRIYNQFFLSAVHSLFRQLELTDWQFILLSAKRAIRLYFEPVRVLKSLLNSITLPVVRKISQEVVASLPLFRKLSQELVTLISFVLQVGLTCVAVYQLIIFFYERILVPVRPDLLPLQILHVGTVTVIFLGVLFLISVYSIILTIERWLHYRAARSQSLEFALKATSLLKDGDFQGIVALSKYYTKSPFAAVIGAAMAECVEKTLHHSAVYSMQASVRLAIERTVNLESAKLTKKLATLASISSVTALIGVLGTTVALILALGDLSTGRGLLLVVYKALIPTAFALSIAIFNFVIYRYFTERVEHFQREMASATSELTNYLTKTHGEEVSRDRLNELAAAF